MFQIDFKQFKMNYGYFKLRIIVLVLFIKIINIKL